MRVTAPTFVAGHRGLVGSAICRALAKRGFTNLVTRTRGELDLRDARAVDAFFTATKPEYVFLAAAKVGGILANTSYPVDFLRDNLFIQTNVIDAAHRHGVRKLCFLGSSCIYPRLAEQPIREEALLTGALEPTNEWYAVAKIAGIKLCQAFHKQYGFDAISLMPTNLYGPGDNFDPETSHVLPALIHKFHDAKVHGSAQVQIWGSGRPRREFLHVDDLADAACFLMQNYESPEIINVGVGRDISIADLVALVQDIIGFDGAVEYDRTKPDGTPRKLLDVKKLTKLGWTPRISLEDGTRATYDWFRRNIADSPS